MPGIVGIVTKMPRTIAESQLSRMVGAMCNQRSYRKGTWIDESLGLYVGWTVRRNSFAEGMPLVNQRGDRLVFSGEEYPDPGVVRQLKDRGHSVEAGGPSYLVHLFEEDPTFPACLNGRFHGLVADRAQHSATLFNDRYGLHRIYYHESQQAFYFAAEAKAILEVCPELRTVDSRSLGELVACGCVLENRTIFKGIHALPPASAWVVRQGTVQRKETYFRPKEWEEQPVLEPGEYYKELREIFSRNLPRYFKGSERVGMSLTGGLDSRMIMAWQKTAAGSLPCYSFGGMFREGQDVSVARQVASAGGHSYQVIPVGKEFLSRFAHYAERTVYLTDGCTDVSHAPDLYVNECAAEIAPVRMTGNYGGEVLRRVRAFKPVEPDPGLFRPELLSKVGEARETYQRLLHGHPLSFAVFRQAPWHHYGLLSLEQTQVSLRSPYLDNDFVKMVFRAPQSTLTDNSICLKLIADGNPNLLRIPTDRGLAGDYGRLPTAVRRGFLGFTFKAEYAYDYGMPQWVARIDHAFSGFHLERLFLGRHKFYHFRVWYRDALAEYVRGMLLDPRSMSRPYLHGSTLEAMVQSHVKGNRNYTLSIHKALTLELVHRLFLDPR